MSLVTAKEVARVINLDKYGFIGTFFGWLLMKVLRISTINKIYNKNKHLKELEFFSSLLDDLRIRFEIPEEDLRRIPKKGAFITVSNHPLGGIDGILLLKLLIEKRPDFKIIGNFLLHRIEPMKPFILAVNPFEDRKNMQSSLAGVKNALFHLKGGNALGVFPAGEVSTYKDGKLIVDRPWEESAIKLIQKAKVPIIPIYFHAKNSKLFYVLSQLNPKLRTAKLPSELLSQKGRTIKVRIGKSILVKDQMEYNSTQDFCDFIRKKTYMLANPFEKDSKTLRAPSLKISKSPKEIVGQRNFDKMILEVDSLRNNNGRLLISKNYEVFFAPSKKIPNLKFEIGRLREITFREVGEGTNESIDLDRFDGYYHHLFLWDNAAKKLVGAYRMG